MWSTNSQYGLSRRRIRVSEYFTLLSQGVMFEASTVGTERSVEGYGVDNEREERTCILL